MRCYGSPRKRVPRAAKEQQSGQDGRAPARSMVTVGSPPKRYLSRLARSAVPCSQLQGGFHTRQSNLLNSPSRIAKEPMSLKRGGGGTMHGEAGCVFRLVTPLRRLHKIRLPKRTPQKRQSPEIPIQGRFMRGRELHESSVETHPA